MAYLGNPRSWVPYMNSKDCSQGFCSLYCPQWCYVVYPPPPPPLEFPADEDSAPNFSPLVIAIIGVLASAFLLVSYYTIISKYCGRGGGDSPSEREGQEESSAILELDDNHNPSLHEPWHHATAGLDEALIKTITCCKYKRGEGLVGGTDCSVCLGEFQDGESVRLLPKCSHAFHVGCIDTWLNSHSNCPLCRAGIFTFSNVGTPFHHVSPPSVVVEENPNDASSEHNNTHQHRDADENVVANGTRESELDHVVVEEVPKTSSDFRAFSDLGNLRGRHSVIEIRDEDYDESIRRSVSMDHSFQIGDVLLHHMMNQDQQGSQVEGCSNAAGTSKRSRGSYRRRVLHCVLSPITMKRSFSSGRFSLSRNGRGKQGISPV